MIDVSRKELKYIVNINEAYHLKSQLAAVMKSDNHNGLNGYRVRSLYFDTLFDTDFEEKVQGYDKRKKIRLRIYGDNDEIVKLELKQKESSSQRKRSLLLSKEEALQMINADYSFLMARPEPLAHALYIEMCTKNYRPKCVVEYDRVAYFRENNDIRVTFDMNLRATEADFNIFNTNLMLYPVAKSGEITLEVKYNGFLFSYIKTLIKGIDKMQVSNSKYCRARTITKKGRF